MNEGLAHRSARLKRDVVCQFSNEPSRSSGFRLKPRPTLRALQWTTRVIGWQSRRNHDFQLEVRHVALE